MTQKMLSKRLFAVFLVIFLLAGCGEKSNLKPVEEAAAKSPSQIERKRGQSNFLTNKKHKGVMTLRV